MGEELGGWRDEVAGEAGDGVGSKIHKIDFDGEFHLIDFWCKLSSWLRFVG